MGLFGSYNVAVILESGEKRHDIGLDEKRNPRYLKMQVTPNSNKETIRKFTNRHFPKAALSTVTVTVALFLRRWFSPMSEPYALNSGMLHRLRIIISNAKAFILGTHHGLPKKNLLSKPHKVPICKEW